MDARRLSRTIFFTVVCCLITAAWCNRTKEITVDECANKTCDCTDVVKGANAEIAHQIKLNDALTEKLKDELDRIIELENELGKFYGKTCTKGSCEEE